MYKNNHQNSWAKLKYVHSVTFKIQAQSLSFRVHEKSLACTQITADAGPLSIRPYIRPRTSSKFQIIINYFYFFKFTYKKLQDTYHKLPQVSPLPLGIIINCSLHFLPDHAMISVIFCEKKKREKNIGRQYRILNPWFII